MTTILTRINCKQCVHFAGKPVATNNFGLCFAAKKKFYGHFLATTFFQLAPAEKS